MGIIEVTVLPLSIYPQRVSACALRHVTQSVLGWKVPHCLRDPARTVENGQDDAVTARHLTDPNTEYR